MVPPIVDDNSATGVRTAMFRYTGICAAARGSPRPYRDCPISGK